MLGPGQTWVYFAAGPLEEEAKVLEVAPTPTRTAMIKRPRILAIRFNLFSDFQAKLRLYDRNNTK